MEKNYVRIYRHTQRAKVDSQKTDFTIHMFFLHSCEDFIFSSLWILIGTGETPILNFGYLQRLFLSKKINEAGMLSPLRKTWNVVTLHSGTCTFIQPTTRAGRELHHHKLLPCESWEHTVMGDTEEKEQEQQLHPILVCLPAGIVRLEWWVYNMPKQNSMGAG